jgi:hypothetical protein
MFIARRPTAVRKMDSFPLRAPSFAQRFLKAKGGWFTIRFISALRANRNPNTLTAYCVWHSVPSLSQKCFSPRRSDEIIVYLPKFGFVAWIVLTPSMNSWRSGDLAPENTESSKRFI